MKLFFDELSTFALSLSEGERKLFSPPFRWVCLANGDTDFQDNVIFFGFAGGQSDPALVVKVPRLLENGWMLQAEYEQLVELWDCVGPAAAKYVPKPYGLTSLQERPVLMISYVPGESLTRLGRKSFWGDSRKVAALANEAARKLRELNQLTESPKAPEEASNPDLESKVDKFRELFKLKPEEERALSKLVKRMHDESKATRHKVLIQGDFWHGNMIRDKQRGTLMFVDWQFARWSSDVSLDVYFFLLAGALSATASGPVEGRAKSAYQRLREWRLDVIPAYLAAYGTPEHYALLPQKYGMLLCCVEKAVRSAADDLLWRYLFAELQNWPDED